MTEGRFGNATLDAYDGNLIHAWKLDEASGTRIDGVGGYDLTDNNTVGSASGKSGRAADFEESASEYLSYASPSMGTGSLTVSMWVKAESLTTQSGYHDIFGIFKGGTIADSSFLMRYVNTAGYGFAFKVHKDTTEYTAQVGSGSSVGVWYHLLGRFDAGTALDLFVAGSKFTAASCPASRNTGDNPLMVGARSDNSSYWDGLIDEICVWDTALSDAAVAILAAGAYWMPFTVPPKRRITIGHFPPTETLRGFIRRARVWETGEEPPPPPPRIPFFLNRRLTAQPLPRTASRLFGATKRRPGRPDEILVIPYFQTFVQFYRVADLDYERYEAFVAYDDELMDWQNPAATSATLPFSIPVEAPPSGTRTVRVVCRKRNRYGLASLNVYEREFVIDDNGDEVTPDPRAPRAVRAIAVEDNYVKVLARYNVGADGDNAADVWNVYAAVGTDPVPGVDTPEYTGTISANGGYEAAVAVTLGPYDPDDDVRVIVEVERSADSATAQSGVVSVSIPTTPDAPTNPTAFGGTEEWR